MAKGTQELKEIVKNYIRWGKSADEIFDIMVSQNKDMQESVISDIVDDTVEEYPNYGLIQKVVRSKIICDRKAEDSKYVLLDEEKRRIDDFDRFRLREVMHSKFDFNSITYTCKYDYKPLIPGMLIKDTDDCFIYNTYKPPFWQKDWFYTNGKEEPNKIDKIPKIYENFFKHLVGNEDDSQESYDYLIKWLANALRRRNYCILTTIGNQGIGKGVLGSIMGLLFGESNYYPGTDKMIKSSFNSQIANKRLVYCDEIFVKTREDEDKLKLVVNDTIEIEKKGIDAKSIDNYASFYISNNNLDAIKVSSDDRRFSIIQLTNVKLLNVMTPSQIQELLKEENIQQLAEFLWHFEVDEHEMGKVFKSKRTQEVRLHGLETWEEWFLFDFCQNNKGKFFEITNELNEIIQLEQGIRVGRGKLMDLSKKFDGYFKVSNMKGNQKRRTFHVVVNEEIIDEI